MTQALPRGASLHQAQPALRARRPGWRDPRIVVGVLIVALSVLAGARLLAAADDTVGVWAVRHNLPAGAALRADELVPRRVHFAEGSDAARYLPSDRRLPGGATLARDIGAGELLPRSAVTTVRTTSVVEVPLAVAPEDVPATVTRGSVVDVWAVPDASRGAAATRVARRVLADVTVLRVAEPGASLAPSATRQVIVGVPEGGAPLGPALTELAGGRIVLTGKG
jgi:hypothetical protein